MCVCVSVYVYCVMCVQAREHEAALARLQQRIRALSEERGLWEEQTARLQVGLIIEELQRAH